MTSRSGFALAVVVFAMALVGAMVAGSFFVGWQERQIERNAKSAGDALAAAEAGAYRTLVTWDGRLEGLEPGDSAPGTAAAWGATGRYRTSLLRLNRSVFLVRSEAWLDDGGRHRVGLLVRLEAPNLDPAAALVSAGPVTVTGGAAIDGRDVIPPRWTCDSVGGPAPDTRSTTGSADGELDRDWFAGLRRYSTKIVPGGAFTVTPTASSGVCNVRDRTNWGEPADPGHPCSAYFPVVWVVGDATVNQVRGQGILIVDGDLTLEGGFEYFGVVVVRGRLATRGVGGRVWGGAIAGSAALAGAGALGVGASIQRSTCAIGRALEAAGRPRPLTSRSWVAF